MKPLLRHALIILGLGIAVASASPLTQANGIDPDRLVKFGERDYIVDYADWVSTDPITTHRVKKIEAGRVSQVTITRTLTGTYSTDGLVSRHVQYPGISVRPAEPTRVSFSQWSNGRWTSFHTSDGDSIISISTYNSLQNAVQTIGCIAASSFLHC